MNWNAQRVRNLTPLEVWFFILGRVLLAFAVGVFAAQYFPRIATAAAPAALLAGAVFLVIALRGLARKSPAAEA